MVGTQNKTLSSVISSRSGLHLSVYLENNGNLQNLRIQIDECLDTAREMLRPVMSTEDLRKFLAPLMRLRKDTRSLRSFSGNIAFFRNESWSRIVNLPVPVEQICVVADTFHTKPLLRWMQQDQEFLLVCLGDEYANLFWGNMTSFEFVDSLPMHRPIDDELSMVSRRTIDASRRMFFVRWLNSALAEMEGLTPRHLFIGSHHHLAKDMIAEINHKRTKIITDTPGVVTSRINFYRDAARKRVQRAVRNKIGTMMAEYALADKLSMTTTDIVEIARLAAEDRIETLFVAGDTELFGRLDKDSGSIDLNPVQTDHLDDCILDDIAQIATAHGAQVVVMEQTQIPGSSAAAAILRPGAELSASGDGPSWLERRA